MRASTVVATLSLIAWVTLSVALPLPATKFERASGHTITPLGSPWHEGRPPWDDSLTLARFPASDSRLPSNGASPRTRPSHLGSPLASDGSTTPSHSPTPPPLYRPNPGPPEYRLAVSNSLAPEYSPSPGHPLPAPNSPRPEHSPTPPGRPGPNPDPPPPKYSP